MGPPAFFQGGLQVAVVPSPHVLAAALLYHDAVLPFDKPDLRPRVETVPLPNRLGDRHLAFLGDPHCDSSSSGITFLQRNYTPLRKGCQGRGGDRGVRVRRRRRKLGCIAHDPAGRSVLELGTRVNTKPCRFVTWMIGGNRVSATRRCGWRRAQAAA